MRLESEKRRLLQYYETRHDADARAAAGELRAALAEVEAQAALASEEASTTARFVKDQYRVAQVDAAPSSHLISSHLRSSALLAPQLVSAQLI